MKYRVAKGLVIAAYSLSRLRVSQDKLAKKGVGFRACGIGVGFRTFHCSTSRQLPTVSSTASRSLHSISLSAAFDLASSGDDALTVSL